MQAHRHKLKREIFLSPLTFFSSLTGGSVKVAVMSLNGSQPFKPLLYLLACLPLLALSACGNDVSDTTDALNIIADELPEAFINEEYAANILVRGGQTPFNYELTGGQLPPGIELQNGTIRGTPTEEGSFEFTVTVSDARLAKTFRNYSLTIGEAPPATLTLNVPDTEIQSTVLLRGTLTDARRLEAFRTRLEWDAELFRYVEGSLRSRNDAFLIFSRSGDGFIQLDVAVLGGDLSDDRRVFEIELRALEPSPLFINKRTEFISASTGHGFTAETEGRGGAPADTNPDINPDGTLPDGTLPDGTLPDGTLPDGTNPDPNTPAVGPDDPTPGNPNPEENPTDGGENGQPPGGQQGDD